MSDVFPAPVLAAAPGAKAAKVCGILAILFALTCIGFPVAIVLGIVALVQQGKAKRLAKAEPGRYAPVPATGLVTGIISLVLSVIVPPVTVSAIAIPALSGQRKLARDRAATRLMTQTLSDMSKEFDRLVESQTPREVAVEGMESWLRRTGVRIKNPWNPARPAFIYTIDVVMEDSPDSLKESAEKRAVELGVSVFVISRSGGLIAGAVRVDTPVNGKTVAASVVPLRWPWALPPKGRHQ